MNLVVYAESPVNPVQIDSSQETQSKFPIGANPAPKIRITATEMISMAQFKYQETTALWNFFIFRIEMVPAADRNRFKKSRPYKT